MRSTRWPLFMLALMSVLAQAQVAFAQRVVVLEFDGDKKKVAAALQISLNTLYSRLSEYKTS